jgi:hypothetical protein
MPPTGSGPKKPGEGRPGGKPGPKPFVVKPNVGKPLTIKPPTAPAPTADKQPAKPAAKRTDGKGDRPVAEVSKRKPK